MLADMGVNAGELSARDPRQRLSGRLESLPCITRRCGRLRPVYGGQCVPCKMRQVRSL